MILRALAELAKAEKYFSYLLAKAFALLLCPLAKASGNLKKLRLNDEPLQNSQAPLALSSGLYKPE